MAFARFMAGTTGRVIRIIAGVALVAIGLLGVGETTGIVIAVIGVLPILAGLFNVCMIAPLIGAPFAGRDALR